MSLKKHLANRIDRASLSDSTAAGRFFLFLIISGLFIIPHFFIPAIFGRPLFNVVWADMFIGNLFYWVLIFILILFVGLILTAVINTAQWIIRGDGDGFEWISWLADIFWDNISVTFLLVFGNYKDKWEFPTLKEIFRPDVVAKELLTGEIDES